MIVKTKNYKLDKKTYINTAFRTVLKQQGWIAVLGVIVICCGYFIPGADSIWWFIGAIIALFRFFVTNGIIWSMGRISDWICSDYDDGIVIGVNE